MGRVRGSGPRILPSRNTGPGVPRGHGGPWALGTPYLRPQVLPRPGKGLGLGSAKGSKPGPHLFPRLWSFPPAPSWGAPHSPLRGLGPSRRGGQSPWRLSRRLITQQ